MREGGFPAPDDPLDDGGVRLAEALALPGPGPDAVLTSPALAARQTATALKLEAALEPALADIDHGDWTGQDFGVVHARAPDAFAAWLASPASGAPGGERLEAVVVRIGAWLDGVAARGGTVLALTHPMVVRAALACALDLPTAAALRIDIAPLTTVTLSYNGVWRLQALRPAAG